MNPSSCTSRQKPLKSKIDALKWANSLLEDYNLCLKILSIVLKKDKSYILAHIDEKIKGKNLKKFKEIVKKLKNGIPLAYILREETFYGLKFKIKKGVFIPRPETEFLVDYVLKLNLKKSAKILDIGTGSGAIAVSLKKFNKKLKVFASDISLKALFQAKKNARMNKVKINFFCGDLLQPLKAKFDIIATNPPYIPKGFLKKLPENVKKEPEIALNGGKGGFKIINKILKQARDKLKENGLLVMEIGDGQFENIKEKAKKMGYNFMDKIMDFSNIERIVVFKWSN